MIFSVYVKKHSANDSVSGQYGLLKNQFSLVVRQKVSPPTYHCAQRTVIQPFLCMREYVCVRPANASGVIQRPFFQRAGFRQSSLLAPLIWVMWAPSRAPALTGQPARTAGSPDAKAVGAEQVRTSGRP